MVKWCRELTAAGWAASHHSRLTLVGTFATISELVLMTWGVESLFYSDFPTVPLLSWAPASPGFWSRVPQAPLGCDSFWTPWLLVT